MTLGTECAVLLGVQQTVFWNHLKGIQDVFSKIILCCEPIHCSWRRLGVQLQKHIPHWSQNVRFFNNNGQTEPTRTHHLVHHNWLFQMLLWSDAVSLLRQQNYLFVLQPEKSTDNITNLYKAHLLNISRTACSLAPMYLLSSSGP